MTNKRKVIVDCDPGLDDAAALLLAFQLDNIDLLGITTVHGNLLVDYTVKNAAFVCDIANQSTHKIFKGCSRPLIQKTLAETAQATDEALKANPKLNEKPVTAIQSQHAVDFIIETALQPDNRITLIQTAPLTNLALALIKEPAIVHGIEQVIIMGGTRDFGQMTPAAEFNFLADPHAAKVVMESGLNITLITLELFRQIEVTQTWFEALRNLPGRAGNLVDQLLKLFYISPRLADEGAEVLKALIADPCTVLFLANPALFIGKKAHVDIEIVSPLGLGRSYIDWEDKLNQPKNVYVVTETTDPDAFLTLYLEVLKRYQ